jgi:hypothetical protein
VGTLILSSLLVITPTTFAQEPNPDPQITSPDVGVSLYLPFVAKCVNTDLTIGHVEITQAVQTDSNSVTLVANRQTVVRVYTQSNSSYTVDGVYVSISAYRSGSELPSSPLSVGPGISPVTWSRADINTSFNTLLPSAWLSGNVTLYMTVNPSETVDENDYTNNTVTKSMSFTSVPALNITVVPIYYRHSSTGKIYSPASSSFIQAAFERFYPVGTVNVTVHSQYAFSGNLNNYEAWSNLLDIVTTIKENEGAPESQVYYGLIPLLDSNGNTWWGSSGGGYAGLGWVGYRVAIGITDAYLKQYEYYVNGKDIANHEVGHNFGRYHAPCGDPSNPDSNFPYTNGVVGQYGFDMSAWQVIPKTYQDIMGYCDPNWISDYTYLGLLENQLDYGAREIALSTTDNLYVRASIGDDGTAILQPVYALPGYPDETPADSEYTLEFIDANGDVIAFQPVAVHLAEGKDFQTRSIHATLPKPELPFSNIRLVRNGVTVGERSLAQSGQLRTTQPAIYLENGELILNWGTPQIPAMVRYTIDKGETWTTLGFDILEGELRMDPQSLPLGSLLFEIITADTTESTSSISWEHIP